MAQIRAHLDRARDWADFLGELAPPAGVSLDQVLSELQRLSTFADPLVMAWWAVRHCAERDADSRAIAGSLGDQLRPRPGWAGGLTEWNGGLGDLLATAIADWEREWINPGHQRWVGPIQIHAGLTRQRIPELSQLLLSLAADPGLGQVESLRRQDLEDRIHDHRGGRRFFTDYLLSPHGRRSIRGLSLLINDSGWPRPDWRRKLRTDALPGLPAGFLGQLLIQMDANHDRVADTRGGSVRVNSQAAWPRLVLRRDGIDGCRLGLFFPTPGVTGHNIEGVAEFSGRDLADRTFLHLRRIEPGDATRWQGRCGRPRRHDAAPDSIWKLPGWPADVNDWAIFGPNGELLYRRDDPEKSTPSGRVQIVMPEPASGSADPFALGFDYLETEDLGWLDLSFDGGDWRVLEARVQSQGKRAPSAIWCTAGPLPPQRYPDWLDELRGWSEDQLLLLDPAEPQILLDGWTATHARRCDVSHCASESGDGDWTAVTGSVEVVQRQTSGSCGVLRVPGSRGRLRLQGRGLHRGNPNLNFEIAYRVIQPLRLRTDRALYAARAVGRVEMQRGEIEGWTEVQPIEAQVSGGVPVTIEDAGGPLRFRLPVHRASLTGPAELESGGYGWLDFCQELEDDRRSAERKIRWRLTCRPWREGSLWIVAHGADPKSLTDLHDQGEELYRLSDRQPAAVTLTHADLRDALRDFRSAWPTALAGDFYLEQQGSVASAGATLVMDDRLDPLDLPSVVSQVPVCRDHLDALAVALASPEAAIVAETASWPQWARQILSPWKHAARELAKQDGLLPDPRVADEFIRAVNNGKPNGLPPAWRQALEPPRTAHEPRLLSDLRNYEIAFGRVGLVDRQRSASLCEQLRARGDWVDAPQSRSLLLLCRVRAGDVEGFKSDLREWLAAPAPFEPRIAGMVYRLCPSLPHHQRQVASKQPHLELPAIDQRWSAVVAGDPLRPDDDWLAVLVAGHDDPLRSMPPSADVIGRGPRRNPFWSDFVASTPTDYCP